MFFRSSALNAVCENVSEDAVGYAQLMVQSTQACLFGCDSTYVENQAPVSRQAHSVQVTSVSVAEFYEIKRHSDRSSALKTEVCLVHLSDFILMFILSCCTFFSEASRMTTSVLFTLIYLVFGILRYFKRE